MSIHERDRNISNNEGNLSPSMYIADVISYTGRSERIKGFRRIKEAIKDIPGIQSVDPIILLEDVYHEYEKHGISDNLKDSVRFAWESLEGDHYPLIVRRLFPDEKGEAQSGPRSGNVTSTEELFLEVEKFYKYYDQHYLGKDVTPEIMIHRVIDAGNPPKQESPFLPYPGGDVVYLGANKFQVRATFGADESVQGFPADIWEVEFRPDDSLEIHQTTRAQKTESIIPGADTYKKIFLPKEFQETPALNNIQVLSIADACRRMTELHGPHRLEFDGTKIKGQELLAIIESAPFSFREHPREAIADFVSSKTKPIMTFHSEQDFDNIPESELLFAHIPNTYFQGNERREALTRLSIIAREKKAKLVVFAAGNIATQHAVRIIMDNGHIVIFIGNEELKNGEEIRLFTKNNDLMWERENPIVLQDHMEGRGIDRIGGKAFGLHKLEKNGFRTSPYFVIETSLFRRIIEAAGVDNLLGNINNSTDPEEIRRVSQAITRSILSYNTRHIPSLTEALMEVNGEKFSVRSSAICEDGKYSFAGIFKTRLNVTPDDINMVILEVLASGVSEDAIRMARTLDIKPSQMQMSVIIQSMVDAKKAGTIFTRDHMSGDESLMRIDAVEGLGEAIVDGTAKTPQSLVIDIKTGLIQQGDIYLRRGNVLTTEEIQMLVELGLKVESSLREGPQDIEWAIDQNGEIFLLQTRPL